MELIYLLPVLIATVLVPLVVHKSIVPFSGSKHPAFLGYEFTTDFFFWGKSVFVLIAASIAFLVFVSNLTQVKKSGKAAKYLTGTLALLATLNVVSSLCSPYRDTVLLGFPGAYEGTFSYLSYYLLCFYSFVFLCDEKRINKFNMALGASALVIGVVGMSEYFGARPLNSWLAKLLIWGNLSPESSFYYPESGIISSSFGNSNTVGSYATLLFPYTLVLFIRENGNRKKIFWGITHFFVFGLLFGSHSRAAYLGLVVGMGSLCFLLPNPKQYWKKLSVLCSIELLLLLSMAAYSRHFHEAKQKTMRDFSLTEQIGSSGMIETLRNIEIENGLLILTTDRGGIILVPKPDGIVIKDLLQHPVPVVITDGMVHPTEPSLSNFRFKLGNEGSNRTVTILHPDFNITAVLTQSGFMIAERNVYRNPVQPEIAKLGLSDKAGSGRIYIWSRTLPLLKNLLFMGLGPGAFPYDFPQNDYVGKINTFGGIHFLVEKPHNGYLQFAHAFGLVGLVLFVSLLFFFLYQSAKKMRAQNDSTGRAYCLATFSAILAYSVVLLFNDSSVGVSPLLWIFLGLGYSSLTFSETQQCN